MQTLEFQFPYQGGVHTWQALYTLMCFPGDEERRLQAHRAFYLGNLGNLEKWATSDEEVWKGIAGLEPLRRVLGGWSQIAEAPPLSQVHEEILKHTREGIIVGGILRILHSLETQQIRLDGGPSLNKVIDFLGQNGEEIFQRKRSWSRPSLLKLWANYRTVAPLWAGYVSLGPRRYPEFPEPSHPEDPAYSKLHESFSDYIHHLYCMARRFQEFGLVFKAKGSKTSGDMLLDANSPYLLGDVIDWESYPFSKFSLPPDWVATLKAYRAPKSI
jgi:hypothetical protein